MSLSRRVVLVLVFSALAVAGILSTTTHVPTGPWIGMYTSFWEIWVAVGFALILFLILIQYSDLPWSVVLVVAVLSALIVVNLSRLWGVPFGIRDPYRHLFEIKAGKFSFNENVYPLFAIFMRTLSSITGLSVMTVLGTVSIIASTIGVGLLALSLRRLGLEKNVQQTAVVAGIPIVSAGLVARPYTLATVFILAFIWIVTTDMRRRSIQVVLTVLIFGILWFHPVAFLVGTSVVVTAILLGILLNRYPFPRVQSPPAGWWMRKSFAVVIVLSFTLHIFLFTGIGGPVIEQAVDQGSDIVSSDTAQTTPDGSTPDTPQANTGGNGPESNSNTEAQSDSTDSPTVTRENTPLLIQIQTKFSEFLRRASLGLLLLGAAAVVAFREMFSKELHYLTTAIGIGGAAILVLFVLIDILQLPAFSGRRILTFAPILLFPVFARMLQTKAVIRLTLVVLVLTSGAAIMYTSPATGGVQNGATAAQVDGYRWYHDHGTAPVTGSGSTFRIAQGLFGSETMLEWGNGSWGPTRWQQRDALYPWQVTERPDHVVAISDYERARSRYQATENGVTEPVDQLERFQLSNDRLYDNGNLRFYRRPR